MTFMKHCLWLAVVLVLSPRGVDGAVRVRPTGANVNGQGASSVFLTFTGLRDQVTEEAWWCGELLPAAPDIGLKCDPSTVFGRLPLRFDRSRLGATGTLTDIMSIPASVARRAYQAARAGHPASFFYVRRFVSAAGGPDEYVAVTCRLTGGGALTPLALLDVRLSFSDGTAVHTVAPGDRPRAFAAAIRYTGTGRLQGRWEVVVPGDEPPTTEDLLTEATLPRDERGRQRRYAQIERFNFFLPPTGSITVPGPKVGLLPTQLAGVYMILLRINASDDRESDASAAGPGPENVHTGAVAGFPMPVLRYIVGGEATGNGEGLQLLRPLDRAELARGGPLEFQWLETSQGAVYRVEIGDARETLLSALVPAGIGVYEAPPWIDEQLGGGPLRWRVVALDVRGTEIESSVWRDLMSRSAP